MSDLISRQAAKLAVVEKGQASKRYKLGEFWELNRDEIWEALDSVPSVQPEIIRCKDCNYADFGVNIFGVEYEFCTEWCRDGIEKNSFCSRAERRPDGPD